MKPGIRVHKQATLRVAIAEGLPEHMHAGTREIINLRCFNPKKGYATALMIQTCREADKANIVLIVQPGQFDDGMSTEQLQKWYERFGFTELPKDEGMPSVMSRTVKNIDTTNSMSV